MPVVGFVDSGGRRVKFAGIAAGRGSFDLPRPLLRALAKSYRASDHYGDESVVSVTTLGNPIQQTRLMQRHDIYVDPLRSLWAMHGTLAHAWLEAGVDPGSPDEIVERRLVIDFEGQLVGGTFDLIERSGDEWIGQDYKVIGAYSVSKMLTEGVAKAKIEYALQANVYAYMIGRADAREVVQHESGLDGSIKPVYIPFEHAGLQVAKWQLVTIARDWTASKHEGSIKPVERIDVPLIDAERVENYLRQRLSIYAMSEMCDDAGLPACTRDEMWQGRRCAQWCDAASVCQQFGAKSKRGAK